MDAGGADSIDVAVGARIRTRRQEIRMSQSVLAEHLGVTFQQVQKYERGANRISASALVRAARALDCPGGFLLGAGPGSDASATRQENAMLAELAALLKMPGAVELLRAFVKVRADGRHLILKIVNGLADGSYFEGRL